MVIWPEASVYFLPAARPEEIARISAAAGDAWLLMGAQHGERTADGDRWTNALVTISPSGEFGPRYDKHHLVPFGEYLPYPEVLGLLGLRQIVRQGGFSAGPGPQVLDVPGLPPFSALICYEMIFPHQVVPADRRPAWLLQVTNDGWFGSYGGPQQHLAQARIRAIEQGLPVVRAANTGISAVIDPAGRVLVQMALHTHGHFDAPLPSAAAPTLYAKTGDLPATRTGEARVMRVGYGTVSSTFC